ERKPTVRYCGDDLSPEETIQLLEHENEKLIKENIQLNRRLVKPRPSTVPSGGGKAQPRWAITSRGFTDRTQARVSKQKRAARDHPGGAELSAWGPRSPAKPCGLRVYFSPAGAFLPAMGAATPRPTSAATRTAPGWISTAHKPTACW